MLSFSNRVKRIIEEIGCNKARFAERINISPAYLSQICSGIRTPSDRTIKDICNEFNVSEQWLRTGEGEIFIPRSREKEIEDMVTKALTGSNDFKRAVIKMICSRNEEELKVLEKMLWDIVAELDKEKAGKSPVHIIKIAGRDGSYGEHSLTSDELEQFNKWKSGLARPGDEI